jgi:O-antigen/teichoic acid export membrane protein
MIRAVLGGLWKSPSLRIAAGYSLAGAAYAGAMLLLARALPKPEYGLLGLVVTMLNLTTRTAPLGVDGIVIRHRVEPTPALLGRVLATASVYGVAVVLISWFVYEIETTMLALIFFGTVVGAASYVAASQFQAREEFGISLALDQGNNFVLLAAAGVALGLGLSTALVPVTMFVVGLLVMAALGWGVLFRGRSPDQEPGDQFHWREAIWYWGVAGGALFLHHLDRLMIPELLSFEALATFTVLAAVVGAPFHMLQLGVGFTLLPRLRNMETAATRRRLIRMEGLVTAIAYLGTAILVLVATPWIVRLFVGDKYLLPTGLIIAALFVGLLRLTSSYAKTIVKSIGTTSDLARLNVFSWFSIALAAGGAVVGSNWGLEGLLYGIGVGWIGHSIAGFAIGAKHLSDSSDIVETQPL